jgi:low affinity Fe/Cu permease
MVTLPRGAKGEATMSAKLGWFVRFAQHVSHITGRPLAFITAVTIILIWGISGPLFGFSDTWQLAINTGTTIIAFLMVFVIQNTQNRDTAAMQFKIDELIRVTQKARNVLLDLDHFNDSELEKLRQDYERLAREDIPLHLERRRSRAQPSSEKPTRK